MPNNFRAYSSHQNPELKQLLLPTSSQIVLDVVIGLLFLLILNARAIWHFFTTGLDDSSQVNIGNLISERLPFVYDSIDSLSNSRLVQVVFWLFVGAVAYLAIWLLGNFFTNIRNDIVADQYVHPRFYKRAGYWGPVIARKVFFASITLILLAYVYVALRLLNLLAQLCYSAATNFSWPDSPAELLGSVVIAAALVQIFFTLTKLLVNSWQLISKDL